jgi:hypothetical protein
MSSGKSVGAGAGAGAAAAAAAAFDRTLGHGIGVASEPTRLSELVLPALGSITPLDLRTVENPVIVIHAPRESGCTSLIGALLAGLPGLHAAIVLTDRASATPEGYMHGVLPEQVVFEKRSPAKTLEALIATQRHQKDNFPDEPLPKLALALDDVLYAPATLNAVDFKRNIKVAAGFNITVIIATANAALLPRDLDTFATHVFATRCNRVQDPKLLLAAAFTMFESKEDLKEALDLCRPHEFVVGVLRGRSAVYSFQTPTTLPVFSMALPLVEKLSFALKDA